MVFIYVTSPDMDEARTIARHLLEKKLIACANMLPANSMYWWKEEITEDEEVVMILKTERSKFKTIKKEIEGHHSHYLPCICLIKADSSEEYSNWVKNQLKE